MVLRSWRHGSESRPEHSKSEPILGVFWLEKLNLSSLQKMLKLEHEFTGKIVMIWSLTLVRFIRRHVFDDLQLTRIPRFL